MISNIFYNFSAADSVFDSYNGESQLSEAETALLKDELRKVSQFTSVPAFRKGDEGRAAQHHSLIHVD